MAARAMVDAAVNTFTGMGPHPSWRLEAGALGLQWGGGQGDRFRSANHEPRAPRAFRSRGETGRRTWPAAEDQKAGTPSANTDCHACERTSVCPNRVHEDCCRHSARRGLTLRPGKPANEKKCHGKKPKVTATESSAREARCRVPSSAQKKLGSQ